MGQDVIVIAKNVKQATIDDFKQLLQRGNYPGGTGEFSTDTEFGEGTNFPVFELTDPEYAYHYIEFIEDYIAVHDGCRYGDDSTYQFKLGKMVEQLTGGEIEIISDAMKTADYVYFAKQSE